MNQMKCMSTNCVRPAAPALQRGLCLICYSKAKKMVESGTTTWDEIVELGLAMPCDSVDGDPFARSFREAKERRDAGEGAG